MRNPRNKSGYIYLIKSMGWFKLGIAQDLPDRMRTYRTENPFPIEVIWTVHVDGCWELEKRMLHTWRRRVVAGKEWMVLRPRDVWRMRRYAESWRYTLREFRLPSPIWTQSECINPPSQRSFSTVDT